MRGQLILLLVGFLLHCSWAGPTGIRKRPATCDSLSGQLAFESIKTCTNLTGPSGEGVGRAELFVGNKIDNSQWDDFTDKLEQLSAVDVKIENSNIKRINLPNFSTSFRSMLTIVNNLFLEEIYINIVGPANFDGFTVSINPKLKSIKVITSGAGVVLITGGELSIVNNRELVILQPALNTRLNDMKSLLIEGNRLLKEASLSQFRWVANVYKNKPVVIQDEGECIFKENIQNLGELTGCKYVKGNLKFSSNTTGEAKGVKLSHVTGEIHLGSLHPDKLGFLKGTKIREEQIKSDGCEFELETVPKYENKDKCPPSVNNQETVVWPLVHGLSIGGGILLLAIIVGLLLYCFWWKKKTPSKKSKESSKSSESSRTKTKSGETTSNRGK